jgi:hypothetical protein
MDGSHPEFASLHGPDVLRAGQDTKAAVVEWFGQRDAPDTAAHLTRAKIHLQSELEDERDRRQEEMGTAPHFFAGVCTVLSK